MDRWPEKRWRTGSASDGTKFYSYIASCATTRSPRQHTSSRRPASIAGASRSAGRCVCEARVRSKSAPARQWAKQQRPVEDQLRIQVEATATIPRETSVRSIDQSQVAANSTSIRPFTANATTRKQVPRQEAPQPEFPAR